MKQMSLFFTNIRFRTIVAALVTLVVLSFLFATLVEAGTDAYSSKGKYQVKTKLQDWYDKSRSRQVPVKIYYPDTSKGNFPVIVFSHGLGGSRMNYAFLGKLWASHGYICVHLQHRGSDESVWKGKKHGGKALRDAANAKTATDRAWDVRFAIDVINKKKKNKDKPFNMANVSKIGMAGHSYGAHTTLAAVGQTFLLNLGNKKNLADPRIKAAIPMSAPAPSKSERKKAYQYIKTPCLHMTGTKDDSPFGFTKAIDRRAPFDYIKAGNQYLITFDGGNHMVFAGHKRMLCKKKKDEKFIRYIKASSTAFWDAYLKDDSKAKKWLAGGGFKNAMGKYGKFEKH